MLDPELLRPERIRPLSRGEYHKLIAAGMFEDERLELLRGHLVTMSPQNDPHSAMAEVLYLILVRALGDTYRVRSQLPFAPSDESEPEPDFVISADGHAGESHPQTALLVIEVADSSLRKDRGVKASIYAEAGVAEYWIMNLQHKVVEVMTEPVGSVYSCVEIVDRAGTVQPRALPELVIAVGELPWLDE